ncbi:hypothetical protein Tco_0804197 [Tanacetum coccineum]|uniref:Uncharacterized protein n=1 Tax=Tanacetum coccineum TaxID=301880 RepID=A0ABQ5A3N5_9ASTR
MIPYKTSEGYHAVPPPYTENFMPPKPNLVLANEEEYVFSESITSVPAVETSKVKTSESKPKSVGEPLIEDWISDSEDENETEFKSKQRKPSFTKVEFVKSNEHVKIPRESVDKVENNKQAKCPRKNSQSPRDCDFYEKKMVEKPVWNNARRVNHQNSQRMTHPHPKGNFVPKAVLMKSGLKTLNTARQNSLKAAISFNTARPINTAYQRPTVNSARTTSNVFNRAHSHGNPQLELQEKGVIDNGCSRQDLKQSSYSQIMNKLIVDLLPLKEIPKEKLKFNLFSVSQMCDKKNSVLFTDTECVVLSPNFKLLDENHVLLKVPRKDNMYSVDLKNIVLLGGSKDSLDAGFKPSGEEEKKDSKDPWNENSEVPSTKEPRVNQEKDANVNSTNNINTATDGNITNNVNTISSTINAAGIEYNAAHENIVYACDDDPNMPILEEIAYLDDDEDVGAEADMNTLVKKVRLLVEDVKKIYKVISGASNKC